MDDHEIQTRFRRLERQNRILLALLCAVVGIASIGATRGPIIAQEIRAHRFSVVDPNGVVVDSWYSDEPGSWRGP